MSAPNIMSRGPRRRSPDAALKAALAVLPAAERKALKRHILAAARAAADAAWKARKRRRMALPPRRSSD